MQEGGRTHKQDRRTSRSSHLPYILLPAPPPPPPAPPPRPVLPKARKLVAFVLHIELNVINHKILIRHSRHTSLRPNTDMHIMSEQFLCEHLSHQFVLNTTRGASQTGYNSCATKGIQTEQFNSLSQK